MALDDSVRTVLLVAMVVALIAVVLVELRMLRTRRRRRTAVEDELPDRAHNSLLTTKAIAETLGRGGVRSPRADDAIREADRALRMRNHRVAIELADKARAILREAKLRYERSGNLEKVEEIGPKRNPAEGVTTKEKLTKDVPPNYLQSRFSIRLAREEIDAAKARGRDIGEAERDLAEANDAFEAKEYDVALRKAVRARRMLESPDPPSDVAQPVPSAADNETCTNCGATIEFDDAFCRKCGAKLEWSNACPSCGAEVAEDDAFCRKCGTTLATEKPLR